MEDDLFTLLDLADKIGAFVIIDSTGTRLAFAEEVKEMIAE